MRSRQLHYPSIEPFCRRGSGKRCRFGKRLLYFDPVLLLAVLIAGILLTAFIWDASVLSNRTTASTPSTLEVEG